MDTRAIDLYMGDERNHGDTITDFDVLSNSRKIPPDLFNQLIPWAPFFSGDGDSDPQ